MAATPPVVLTIAGFDPSSGAGITADIKTIAAHECYGVSCITALTIQSTQGVRRVEAVDPGIIAETLQELASDMAVAAVHIGMMGNEQVVAVVADFLGQARLPHVVLDPILKSSSGADLLDAAGTRLLIERLVPLAELVTPNLDEASVLTGMAVTNLDQMGEAAARLHSLGAANVVVTGGHLEKAIDLLSFTTTRGSKRKSSRRTASARIPRTAPDARSRRRWPAIWRMGADCPRRCLLSKAYVSAAIANAHPLGKGVGPLHHLYRMGQQRRPSAIVSETEHVHSRN